MQNNYPTPKCKPYCYNSQYKKKYTEDKHKGVFLKTSLLNSCHNRTAFIS